MGRIRGTVAILCLLASPRSRADGVLDVGTDPSAPFGSIDTLFPNWLRAPAAAFLLEECDDAICTGTTNCPITGITIMNYGTASGGPAGDIRGVYCQIICGSKTDSGTLTLTYAGNWNVGGPVYPAWTWGGSAAWGGDPCNGPGFGCSCFVSLFTYADIGPCPTDGATVELGPGFNDILNPAWPGGVYDSCGYAAPYGPISYPAIKSLRYIMKKVDKDVAAPGDTVNYTIYYGRPGTGSLNSLWITDTLPSYTHYLSGSGTAPDPAWSPDPGPPARLRWTIAGPLATAGGATGAVTFGLTFDWGNGESFEPGSGDFGAPEGTFMFNNAHLSWDPPLGCPPGSTSNSTSTVVKRYLFWKTGDQDVLFAPRFGMPDDEIIYELFVKNVSPTRTWWNVRLWDTVPPDIDAWTSGYGFDDPCTGWTMTPSGCAAATPGKTVAGASTLLTWELDLPPGFTLAVRWKGRVKTSTTVGSTVTNRASLRAYGQSGIIGGSGDAGASRTFTHEALVVLRTTFVSYVGWAGDDNAWFKGCVNQTYFISFYPLNKSCDFALYRKWCCAAAPCDTTCAPFSAVGGVSPKIDLYAGSCTGGPATDWEMGCKVERSPARYIPSPFVAGAQPSLPFNFLHKMVSNAPMVWELSMCLGGGNQDANSYAGTTSLNFCGYIIYSWLRRDVDTGTPQVEDCLQAVNTDDNRNTTLFVFNWNPTTLSWDYLANQDLYRGSQWSFQPGQPAVAPYGDHFRILSSDTKLIVLKAWTGVGVGGSYNDLGTLAPNRESGGLVNQAVPATFYLFAGHLPGSSDAAIVGNVSPVTVNYEVWRYAPLDTTLPSPNSANITLDLVGAAGSWILESNTETVGPLAAIPGPTGANGHVYGTNYDNSLFATRYRLYKVIVTSPGTARVQMYCGRSIVDRYSGGSMLHASQPPGQQTGTEYWVHSYESGHTCTGGYNIFCFDVFCPKVNLGLNCASSDGYSATYTTNDVDEAISFMQLTAPKAPGLRNWRMKVQAGGNPGNVIAQYIECNIGEKFYTAPFLQRGVYYDVIAPPVVFTGQSFWLTIVVIDNGGSTKTDYCGTTSFTSTDPAAKIENSAMDTYNYTWTSSLVAGPCANASGPNGVRIFFQVTFTKLGLQTFIPSDITDGTITGLTTIMVVGADVHLTKEQRFQIAASADTVQFRVCWSNYSSASAFTFVITDAVPMGTTFLPEAGTASFNCGNTDGVAPVVAYSTAPSVTPPAAFTEANPIAGTRWLRFTLPISGVQTTGCICYRVTVN